MEHLLDWNNHNGYIKCVQDSSIISWHIPDNNSIASCVWHHFEASHIECLEHMVDFIGSIPPPPPAVPQFKYLTNLFPLHPAVYHGYVFQDLMKSERFWNVTSKSFPYQQFSVMSSNILLHTKAQVNDLALFKLLYIAGAPIHNFAKISQNYEIHVFWVKISF